MMPGQDGGIDFRDDQRDFRIHAPSRRVVNHSDPGGSIKRGPRSGCGGTGGKNCNVGSGSNGLLVAVNKITMMIEGDRKTCGFWRSNRDKTVGVKFMLVKNFEDFTADKPGGADNCQFHKVVFGKDK